MHFDRILSGATFETVFQLFEAGWGEEDQDGLRKGMLNLHGAMHFDLENYVNAFVELLDYPCPGCSVVVAGEFSPFENKLPSTML